MSQVLEDISAPALEAAIEANLFDLCAAFGQWSRIELHDDPAMLWYISDIPFPLFNGVLRAQFPPDQLDEAIHAAISPFQARNVPVLWWTGPATQPPGLAEHLEAHGFTRTDDSIGMAAILDSLDLAVPLPPSLSIERVDNPTTAEKWCRTLIAGFEIPSFLLEPLSDFLNALGFGDRSPVRSYLASLNGEPVATSTLFLGAGAAGIYNVTAIPEARRQGIGTAITLAPLKEAQRLGYQAAILHASEMGAAVYRRLGFQEYCTLGQYLLDAD